MSEIPDAQVGTLELYRMLSRVEELVKDLDNKLDRNAITTAEHALRIKALEDSQTGGLVAAHELRIKTLETAQATKSTLKTAVLASIPASVIAAVMVVVQILTQH